MQKKRMVIFDYDGVIADTWWLTHKTTRKFFPDITEEAHKDGFEGNIYDAEKRWMDPKKSYTNEEYEGEFQKESHLVKFFKVEDVIRGLAEHYLLSIISSSPSGLIKNFLKREGILECFQDVMGRDVHKSKHEKIKMIFQKHNLAPQDCVMVTDTTGDVREARMASVDSIGVSWGFHELHRFDKVETFRIIHEPKEIQKAVDDYFAVGADTVSK